MLESSNMCIIHQLRQQITYLTTPQCSVLPLHRPVTMTVYLLVSGVLAGTSSSFEIKRSVNLLQPATKKKEKQESKKMTLKSVDVCVR